MTTDIPFDPHEDVELTSEEVFAKAVIAFGGRSTRDVLGAQISHRNADWLLPEHKVAIEHKQLEADFGASESFQRRAFELRCAWARSGEANIFGVPKDWSAVADQWLRLYRRPLEQVIKSANQQIRATRERLGWPKGRGIIVIANRSLREVLPLGMCQLIQGILEGSCSEIGGAIYVTGHYLDIEGSDLANLGWFPIYRQKGPQIPDDFVELVDSFGRTFFRTLRVIAPDLDAGREVPLGSKEAARLLTARPIPRRNI